MRPPVLASPARASALMTAERVPENESRQTEAVASQTYLSPEMEIWGRQKLHPFSWNFKNADSEDDAKNKPHSNCFVMSVVSGHSLG